MTFDPRRTLRALAIGAWAAFFDWMWLSGEAASYAAPRTTWVVTFGAVTLTLAALILLASARTSTPGPVPAWSEMRAVAALIAPVLAVILVPAPTLGAFAVSQKGSQAIVASAEMAESRKNDPVTLYDVNAANGSADYALARGMREGARVTLTGLVSDDSANDRFTLARFTASCCAADATPHAAEIIGNSAYVQRDVWLRVSGELDEFDGTWKVRAGSITPIDEPDNPYAN